MSETEDEAEGQNQDGAKLDGTYPNGTVRRSLTRRVRRSASCKMFTST